MRGRRTAAGIVGIVLVSMFQLVSCAGNRPDGKTGDVGVELKEASTSFDLEHVAPFLDRVVKMIDSGFGPKERNVLVQMVSSMKVEEERTREFNITYHGQGTTLRIHVFMDDVDSPDIAFFTAPELAQRIQQEIEVFFDERGM